MCAGVAQLAVQRICNPSVVGSSPIASSTGGCDSKTCHHHKAEGGGVRFLTERVSLLAAIKWQMCGVAVP